MFVSVYIASQPVAAKLEAFMQANLTVALLCNHRREVTKNYMKQMGVLRTKVCILFSLLFIKATPTLFSV